MISRYLTTCIICMAACLSFHAEAQLTGCETMSFSETPLGPCHYRLNVLNTTIDCYSQTTVLLQSGAFTSWTVNSADGWIGTPSSDTEILLTHSNGLFPADTSWALEFQFYDAGAIETALSVLYDNMCIQEGCANDLVLEACAGGCVGGTVFNECLQLPYTDQPVLEGWEINLSDSEGQLVAIAVTDINGFYDFCNLAPGVYELEVVVPTGWTPNFPLHGRATVSITPEFSLIQDFSNCRSCSCDSIFTGLQLHPLASESCTFSFTLVNSAEDCYHSILIQLPGSSQFTDWNVEMPGWEVIPVNAQLIEILPVAAFLPVGFFVPVSFSMTGDGLQECIITVVSDDGDQDNDCERAVIADCTPLSQSCCPMGSIAGPQLITNGDFELGNTGFTSDHQYAPTGFVSWGNYSIRDVNTLVGAKAGNIWSCLDHTTGTIPGKFFICNHGGIQGNAIWRTTVPVEAGKEYLFCAYLNNLMKPGFANGGCNDPNVELWIVGQGMIASLSVNELPDVWVPLSGTWTAPTTGIVTLEILDSTPTLGCNDIALDDISFTTCAPEPCVASFNVVPIDGCGHVQVINTSTGVQPLTYQWCSGETTADLDVVMPCGSHTFCVTVTCGDGTSSTFSQTINIGDLIPPVIQCPPNITLNAFQPTCNRPVVNLYPVALSDNCGILVLTWALSGATTGLGSGDASGQVFNQGVTILIYTAKDSCGNTSTCSMTVTIDCFMQQECCLEWVDKFGGVAKGVTESLALDPFNNLIACGPFLGIWDFDPGPGTFYLSPVTQNNSDVFITKLNAAGQLIWAVTVGGSGLDFVSGLAIDGAGNIYVAGLFEATADFDPGPSTYNLTSNGTNDGFLLKLSPSGQFLWVAQFGAADFDYALSVAVDGLNDVYVSGYFRQTVDFDPGPGSFSLTSAGGSDIFMVKLSPLGTLIKALAFGSTGHDFAINMDIDLNNNLHVAGGFSGTIDFDPGSGVYNISGGPTFIVKFDAVLNLIWAVVSGGYNSSAQLGIEVDNQGNVLTTGTFAGTNDFDPGPGVVNLTSAGSGDIYMSKLNSNGALVWVKQIGNTYDNTSVAISTDLQGNIISTGYSLGVVDFDPGAGQSLVTANGNYSCERAYILKLDPAGNFMWVKHNQGLGCDKGYSILLDQNGSIYWGGGFANTEDFDPGPGTYFLSTPNVYNAFVAKYSPCPLPDICYCGTYTDLYIRDYSGRLRGAPTCGQTIQVGCPSPGSGFTLTGNFQCAGTSCPPLAPIDWELLAPNGTTLVLGTIQANYWFSLQLPSTYFLQAGVYALTLTGLCGAETCSCTIYLQVDPGCPDPCPCDLSDFENNVDHGFATIHSGSSCNVCFSPISLDNCDNVEWFVNSILVPPVGTSVGNQTFCYSFPGPGVYTIFMSATRYRADGSFCEIFTKSQRVTVTCFSFRDCLSDLIDNPGFSEEAIAGGMDTTGNSKGWIVLSEHPTVVEGLAGSQDGWTIMLTGKADSMDILGYGEPICLAKDTGTISIRNKVEHWGDPHENLNGKHAKNWEFHIYRGPTFEGDSCDNDECLQLASINLVDIDTGWMEIRIPYDLRKWTVEDSCGGVLVRPAVFVESVFGTEQGGNEVRSRVQLDDICFGGHLVAVHGPDQRGGIKFHPNPAQESLTIEFDNLQAGRRVVEVTDQWGRVLISEAMQLGSRQHIFNLRSLTPGLYLLIVKEDGLLVGADKFVRMGD